VRDQFLGHELDPASFAFRDITGTDEWLAFTVSASFTEVGAATYTGRLRIVGKQCQFQIKVVPDTSIATTAGTSFITLPITATGIGGVATMTNDTTNVAVGVCHIDVADSRVYPPSQSASANTFTLCGWFEIGG
jgi:hypothetical protein